MLTLKRASKSRPSGEWSDDDYDVYNGERHIGRILWTHASSTETHWLWDDHVGRLRVMRDATDVLLAVRRETWPTVPRGDMPNTGAV